MRVDSHQHFWQYNPIRDAWITGNMKIIQRDFLPSDLEPILKENIMDGCISVQADQSEAETIFLLKHAEQHQFIKGVVGWVDLCSEKIYERIDYFSQFNKLKGFRHVVQTEPDDQFLLRKDFGRGISALQQKGFTYDILVYPKQLEATVKFVSQFPDQPFVIDHMAKPFILEGRLDNWVEYLKVLSKFENVHCKISGLVTEANWSFWKEPDFKPYLDVVFENFGTKRIMYGSDWPVCLLAATYKNQLAIVENYLASFSESERADVMGNNAVRFYNL